MTTLAGLLVAIPALVMFNGLQLSLKGLEQSVESVTDVVRVVLQKHLILKGICMRRLGRQSRKNRHMLNDLSLTPLIDTALTLLIIFMISAPMMNNSIKITLPKGKAKEETSSELQEMIVTVNKEGTLYLNDIMNKEQLLVK